METPQKTPLPKKLSPCPILEAIIELRFESSIPSEAIFGLLYTELNKTYPKLIKLPILQLPEVVRDEDASLKYQPHYRLEGEHFLINLSPRVFGLINQVYGGGEYQGWAAFSDEFKRILSIFQKMSLITKVERFGIRYVDFFQDDQIFNNVSVDLDSHISGASNKLFKFSFENQGMTTNIQISSDATVNDPQIGPPEKGSLIDIDTFVDAPSVEDVERYLTVAHDISSESFFALLKPQFLKKFNPEY